MTGCGNEEAEGDDDREDGDGGIACRGEREKEVCDL